MRALLSILVFMSLPALAGAAGTETGGLPWGDILKQALNFGILVGLLIYFLRKPVTNFLKDRREILIKSMEEASQANKEAKEKLAKVEEKIARLDEEVERLNRTMEEEARKEFERIKSLTEDEIERIKEQTVAAADQEVKKAREELRKEAAELSVKSAEEIITNAITDEDQKKFVKESISKIKGARK